jgi:hypothetical protein
LPTPNSSPGSKPAHFSTLSSVVASVVCFIAYLPVRTNSASSCFSPTSSVVQLVVGGASMGEKDRSFVQFDVDNSKVCQQSSSSSSVSNSSRPTVRTLRQARLAPFSPLRSQSTRLG